MCSDVGNNKYSEDFKTEYDTECSKDVVASSSNLVNTKEVHLIDVLEVLVSLDKPGIFMDPVDDSFSPNYSNLITNPVCFSTMRKKIFSQQYTSWRSFVEDFENICHNAMNYNQKWSKIWISANTLLCQGKKYLNQQASKCEKILGIYKAMKDNCRFQDTEDRNKARESHLKNPPESVRCNNSHVHYRVCERVKEGHGISVKEESDVFLAKSWLPDKDTFPSSVDAQTASVKHGGIKQEVPCIFFEECLPDEGGAPALVTQRNEVKEQGKEHAKLLAGVGVCVSESDSKMDVPEDLAVEIVEPTPVDDVRLDLDDQATECSSSFEGTNSEGSYPTSDTRGKFGEVQSLIRDGNGATAPADDLDRLSKRQKKPLRAEWKRFREGIEWRCRWLELQVKELQKQATEYDQTLNDISFRKKQKFDQKYLHASAARALPVGCGWKHQVYRRRRRRKVEDDTGLLSYMSKHPVFSRYGKKQRHEQEVFIQDEADAEQFQMMQLDLATLNRQEKLCIEEEPKAGGQDSMEQLLWDIESLQMHVMKLKNQLSRGASMLRKLARTSSKDLCCPRDSSPFSPSLRAANLLQNPTSQLGNRVLSGSLHSGSLISRRRNSDYDINNVVMPGTVMATYTEPARHTFIETPLWHMMDDFAADVQPQQISSSEEDTDEETYNRRHAEMELTERLKRYGPLSNRIQCYEKGSSKAGLQRSSKPRGKGSRLIPLEDTGVRHTGFGCIPKGKRRKRQERNTPFRPTRFEFLYAFSQSVQSMSQDLDAIIKAVDGDISSTMAVEAAASPNTFKLHDASPMEK